MAIFISNKPQEKTNMAKMEVNFSEFSPMFDITSAHVQDVLLDDQLSKPYEKDFSKGCSAIRKIVCQCR